MYFGGKKRKEKSATWAWRRLRAGVIETVLPSFIGGLPKRGKKATHKHKCVPWKRNFRRIPPPPKKVACNSPYEGQPKCVNVRKLRVSALFSAFLRLCERRELGKLVGQHNLFRDLVFFFFFSLSLKLFPLTSQRACTWKSEMEKWERGSARR